MPQIGWFEILIVVVLAILIIGPKDFPVVLKKIGSWISTLKSYFSEFQRSLDEVENSVDDEIKSLKDTPIKTDYKKDE